MPIRFDDAAAETLAGELELTAQAVAELAVRFEQEAQRTVVDWEGRFRDSFDAEALRHERTALGLAWDLHLMAVAVRAGQFEAQAAKRAEAEAAARQADLDRLATPVGTTTTTVPR